jgi:hypothetical protein
MFNEQDFNQFTHCSDKPDLIPVNNEQKPSMTWINYKPEGLWFACGNDWIDWCEREGFNTNTYKHKYSIKEIDSSSILIIDSDNDLTEFKKNYVFIDKPFSPGNQIKWAEIAKIYSGIYFGYRNLKKSLYAVEFINDIVMSLIYSLDVDSLIIWNPEKCGLKISYISEIKIR